MNRVLAERIVNAIEDFKEPFNALDALSQEIEAEDEKRAFRLLIAAAIEAISWDLIAPIVRQYPELDPYKEGA